MSYREHVARYHVQASALGLTYMEAEALRRDAERLHTWAEHECNGVVCRAERGMTDHRGRALIEGATYSVSNINGPGPLHYWRTPDRETGALNRVRALCELHGMNYEVQGDPRGWPLTLTKDGQSLCPPCR